VSTSAQEKHGKQAEEFNTGINRIRKNNQSEVLQEKARLDAKPIPNHSANTMDDDPIDEGSIPKHNLHPTRLVANVEALSDSIDPIESFTSSNMVDVGSAILPRPVATVEPERKEIKTPETRMDDHAPRKADSNKKMKTAKRIWPPSANKSDICECRDANDDQDMINCEICQRWRHLNCYGYKSEKDPRIPDFFVCYRCRIHKGMDLEQIWKREDDINIALEGLRGLCIFRRTLQIIYQEGLPTVLKDLALRLEVDLSTVSQIRHRLETEKFMICPKSNGRTKSSGILESERKGSSKASKSKRYIKNMIVNESYEQKKLRDKLYFTPGTGTEAKLLEKFGNDSIAEGNQDQQMHQSTSSLSSTDVGAVTTARKGEKKVTPTKEPKSVKNKASGLSATQQQQGAEAEDVTMHVDEEPSEEDQARKVAAADKNKVSIGAEQVEVLGVAWDDCSDDA